MFVYRKRKRIKKKGVKETRTENENKEHIFRYIKNNNKKKSEDKTTNKQLYACSVLSLIRVRLLISDCIRFLQNTNFIVLLLHLLSLILSITAFAVVCSFILFLLVLRNRVNVFYFLKEKKTKVVSRLVFVFDQAALALNEK